MSKAFAISIIQTLRQHGFQAYLAGGCVRDLLLNREPADFDVATSATPGQVMEIFPDTYAVGAQFGVVLVPLPEAERDGEVLSKRQAIEVATFRSDHGYSDGRHPDEVRFSKDPQADVARRDLTINGMMLDPVNGEVLDYVGGRADLEAGVIRAIGEPEQRFTEDKLRMLRAVRFASRFEYEIEEKTWAAIQRLAPEISAVSRERVRDEVTKMLTEGHARRAFLLLDQTGLLKEVLPEISRMKGVEQPAAFHPEGDVFTHTLIALEYLPHPCSATLAWGTLLHDVGKPATFRVAPDRIRFDNHVAVGVKIAEEICSRLRFSRHDTEQVLALIDNHMRFGHVSRMKESTLKRFMRLPGFEEHLALHRADSLASHGILTTYEFLQERLKETPVEDFRPLRLITGDDLVAAGYAPGPRFSEILGAVEDGQLEGHLTSRKAAMEFVERKFPH
ncbi:MAG: CCA tRNA nucleotidyltransferase [Candidatus Sulfotelmatobacter sp.]|jgi:poly(A) polymerase